MKNVLVTMFIVPIVAAAILVAALWVPTLAWADWHVLRVHPAFFVAMGCLLIALASSVLYYKNTVETRCGVALLGSLLIHGLLFFYLNTIPLGRLDLPRDRQVVLNIERSNTPITVKDYAYYWASEDEGEESGETAEASPEPEVAPVLDVDSEMKNLAQMLQQRGAGQEPISVDEVEAVATEIEATPQAPLVDDLTSDEAWQSDATNIPLPDPAQVVPQTLDRPEGTTLTAEELLPATQEHVTVVTAPNVKTIDLREASRQARVNSRTSVKPVKPQPEKILPGEQQQWGEMALEGTPQGNSKTSQKVLAGTGEEDAPAGTQYTVASRNQTAEKKPGIAPREDARLSKGGQSTGAVASRSAQEEREYQDYLAGAVNGVSDRVLEDVTKVREISGSDLPGEAQREQLISDVATVEFEESTVPELGNLPPDTAEELPMSDAEWEKEIASILADRVTPTASDDGEKVAITPNPTVPYRQRKRANHREMIREAGGDPEAETMVERGLEFMKRTQFSDGHWSFDHLPGSVTSREVAEKMSLGTMNSDTAATGLGLLVFLGSGYTHIPDAQKGTDYHEAMSRGIAWLVSHQQPDGALFSPQQDADRYARIYAHGIASIALCEAYGMTRDSALREPAQRAVNFILKAQSPKNGGWRYTPENPGEPWRDETDTSVSGWQLMALVSAKHAGLDVPDSTLNHVKRWIDAASIDGGARFCYLPVANPENAEMRTWVKPSHAMTAEGLLMELYLGYRVGTPEFRQGVNYLAGNLPSFQRGLRDTYYWYYATQVMYHVRGPQWDEWQDQLVNHLRANQEVKDSYFSGSWDPRQDKWGAVGGRHYVTAMHLLTLEVYYRHLPLFKSLRADSLVENRNR